jgi:pimeloyl-ACP methyl ester carboxylesterase
MNVPLYTPTCASSSHSSPVRGITYHWRSWGEKLGEKRGEKAPLFLLHGWMDVGASWQFVVDALQAAGDKRHIIAPDWRGFGASASHQDSFYFPDYLGDLDALIPQVLAQFGYAPDTPVDVAGHSMGAHAALLYAAARPERLRKLINIEGFGAPPAPASAAPRRYTQWLNELQALRAGKLDLAGYDSQEAVAQRLLKTNPRIKPEYAHWLAGHWAAPENKGQEAGRWQILGAAAHKISNPALFRVEEVEACYAAIACPVLTLLAEENRLHKWQGGHYSLADYLQRLAHLADNKTITIANAGHMLHHDQPQAVAQAISDFLNS